MEKEFQRWTAKRKVERDLYENEGNTTLWHSSADQLVAKIRV